MNGSIPQGRETAHARLVVRRAKCKQNYQIERPSPMQMIVRHFKVFTLGFHFASAFIFFGGGHVCSHIFLRMLVRLLLLTRHRRGLARYRVLTNRKGLIIYPRAE